jgi:O-antigen ligase
MQPSLSFSSAYACKMYPKNNEGKYINVVVAPVWNLFPLANNILPFLFSISLLVVIYMLLYYSLPIGFWNSTDNQYVDSNRCILTSLITYYVISVVLTAVLHNRGCSDIQEQAREYISKNA